MVPLGLAARHGSPLSCLELQVLPLELEVLCLKLAVLILELEILPLKRGVGSLGLCFFPSKVHFWEGGGGAKQTAGGFIPS